MAASAETAHTRTAHWRSEGRHDETRRDESGARRGEATVADTAPTHAMNPRRIAHQTPAISTAETSAGISIRSQRCHFFE